MEFRLLALLFFIALAAPLSMAACDYQSITVDCNVMGVSISVDANEYAQGQGGGITISVNARKNPLTIQAGNPAININNITVSLTRIRPGFENTPTQVDFNDGSNVFNFNADMSTIKTATLDLDSLITGTYSFSAIITAVNGSVDFRDNETSDNYAAAYAIVKKEEKGVPDLSPVLVALVALSVLFIMRRGAGISPNE